MKSRRQVLVGTLGLSAVPLASSIENASAATAADDAADPDDDAPFLPISLAQWSLHRTLRSGELSNLGFPAFARETFGLEAVEYVSTFFERGATDFRRLGELERAASDAGVRNLLVMVDAEGRLGAEDDAERRVAVHRHFKWIAAAKSLGCHAIRVNAAGSGARDDHARRAAESLHHLCEVADEYELSILVENHGGPSSDGAWLARTIELADHPRCGTLPDFGNFLVSRTPKADGEGFDLEWYDRYQGVRELMPYAKAVSAKSYDFDADGNETRTDYARMLRIVFDAGYRGHIGIEFEGSQMSEIDGIRATQALLERTRAALKSERER